MAPVEVEAVPVAGCDGRGWTWSAGWVPADVAGMGLTGSRRGGELGAGGVRGADEDHPRVTGATGSVSASVGRPRTARDGRVVRRSCT